MHASPGPGHHTDAELQQTRRSRLPTQILADTAPLSTRTSLLIAHHEDFSHAHWPPCQPLTTERLKEMAGYGVAAWPVHYALDSRMALAPTPEHLDALSALGTADLGMNDAERVPRCTWPAGW
ncbi:hypothetical protein ACFV1N_39195 [Streptosporangium canum]|uniref:hypothetical protein n=1 Tax=Streptosporangium canum TaxID=324952 RepID=UPI0036ADA97F